jgi:TP901 family phage tail tape measure protein
MNAYGKENLSAARAADILIASVKEGKAEANELAQSMGIVLPIASKLGAGFDQVGAAMAAMTRTGTKAATAAMQTRQILNKLVKPAKQSEDAIRELGSSFGELRHIVATEGIIPALLKVNELTKEYGVETVAKIFPNIRALAGVLDILGANLGENLKAQEAITNSVGALNHAFNTISKTFQFKVNQLISQTKTLFIELGEAIGMRLIPIIGNLLEMIRKWTDGFNSLNLATQDTIVKMSLLAVAMGPAIIAFNILSKTLIAPLVAGFFTLQEALKKVAIGYSAVSAGSGAFIVSSTKVVHGLKAITASMAAWMGTNPVGAIMLLVGAIATLLLGVNRWRKANEELTLTQKSLNEARVEAQRILLNEQRVLDSLLKTATNENTSKDMRVQAVRRLNELSPAYLRNLTEENVRTEKGTELVNKYIKSLERKAEAEALSNQMTKLAEKRIDDLTTGMDRHLSTMEILWANYQGLIKTVWIWQTKSNIAAELRARQDNKAKEALQEYMDAMDELENRYKRNKFSLEEIKNQYGLISDEIKGVKGTDEMYAKSVINNIKEQIKYGKEYIAYLKETAKIKAFEFAFPLVKESNLPKVIGGKGWIYEFFQLDRAGDDLNTVEGHVKKLEGFLKHMNKVMDDFSAADEWEQRQEHIKEFWDEYKHQLETVENAHKIFGNSYDLLSEKLSIYQKTLMSIAGDRGLATESQLNQVKQEYDITKLIVDTRSEYNDKLGKAADAAIELNDLYQKQYGYQDQIKNKFEEINRGLSVMRLAEKMPWLIQPQDLIGVEKLAEWIKFLEKEGFTMLSIYKELKTLLEGIKVGEDITDFSKQMEDLNYRISLIGKDTDLLNEKLRLQQDEYRKLLKAPIEDSAKWIEALKAQRKEIELTKLSIEMLGVRSQAIADIFTGLGESIGKAMAGTEGAFQGMLEVFLSVIKKIGTTLITFGSILIFTKVLAGLGAELLIAGTAIVALSSAVSASRENVSKAAEKRTSRVGMAQGGIVPQGYPRDSYPAMLTSGERVIPPKPLQTYERDNKVHVVVEGKIKGQDIYYITKEVERKYKGVY